MALRAMVTVAGGGLMRTALTLRGKWGNAEEEAVLQV